MELLEFLPYLLIAVGAIGIVHFASAKPSGRKLPTWFIWILAIAVPLASQALAAMIMRHNELDTTQVDWEMVDHFRMSMSDAHQFNDLLCRTFGAIAGIIIVAFLTGVVSISIRRPAKVEKDS